MKQGIWPGCVALLVCLTAPSAHAGDKKDAPSPKQIRQWVQHLGDDDFAVRQEATTNLLKSGSLVITEVAAAATGGDPEVTGRALLIVSELANSLETDTSKTARKALVDLAVSKHGLAAGLARKAMAPLQQRVKSALEAIGASVNMNDGMIVAAYFDNAKTLGEELQLLHELPDLEYLSFSTQLMDDDGLAMLAGLQRVRQLNLYQARVGDAGMKYLKTMPNLRWLPMGETRVTDMGLIQLKDMTQLEYVGLRANRVTDKGVVHLQKLTNLTGLYLGETRVTDAGLIHLRPLTKLTSLRLDNTKVSDAGLEQLKVLTKLESITLWHTQVSQAGFDRLKEWLPKLQGILKEP